MTLPRILAKHDHISEREVAHVWPDGRQDNSAWEDCLWDSAVEWYRLCFDPSVPATHAEAERLRFYGNDGVIGGSNVDNLVLALRLRFGLTSDRYQRATQDSQVLYMPVGSAAVVGGSFRNIPYGHRLRRWLPSYTGGHAVFVARTGENEYWWCDPLATDNGYLGEYVSRSNLAAFMAGWAAHHLIAPILEDIVPAAITDEDVKQVSVAKDSPLYELDGKTLIRTQPSDLSWRLSPFGVGELRAIFVTVTGEGRQLALVKPSGVRDYETVIRRYEYDRVKSGTKQGVLTFPPRP